MNKKQRYQYILDYFRQRQPEVSTELEFGSVFQLLVATMLSAQCTDKRVNSVTPELFRRYPDAQAMAQAQPEEILEYVKSVSYPNAKSEHLAKMARMLVDEYGGEVPDDPDSLVRLPGVGRKTANVIRGNIYHDPSIVVDTHVKRIAKRLGLTQQADPVKVEYDLMEIIPQDHWILINLDLIALGRTICRSQSPKCAECFLADICPSCSRQEGGGGEKPSGNLQKKRV